MIYTCYHNFFPLLGISTTYTLLPLRLCVKVLDGKVLKKSWCFIDHNFVDEFYFFEIAQIFSKFSHFSFLVISSDTASNFRGLRNSLTFLLTKWFMLMHRSGQSHVLFSVLYVKFTFHLKNNKKHQHYSQAWLYFLDGCQHILAQFFVYANFSVL